MSRGHHGGESDWDDQDLLTLDEAEGRLIDELEATTEQLRRARAGLDASDERRQASVDLHQRRHDALVEALDRIRRSRSS